MKTNAVRERHAASALAALGNPTRLRLYRLLVRAGRPGLNIGALQGLLRAPASTLAHHLMSLVRAGLVKREQRGREVIARADYAAMAGLVDFLTSECCAGIAPRQTADCGNPANPSDGGDFLQRTP